MRLSRLRVENLRAFRELDIEFAPGWNVLVGSNGAGKTTVLEAAYLLSHARSFRSGAREALTRRGADGYSVFGELSRSTDPNVRVGLAKSGARLEARVDGETLALSDLLRHVAVVCFEPGSHELIAGASELRRRFLDWGVFHVEHRFLAVWRRFQRALKQRNALLKAGGSAAELDAWDEEFASAGAELDAMRRRYLARFAPLAAGRSQELLGDLGAARVEFDSGWNGAAELAEHLAASRDDDLRRGWSGVGPQRADWSVTLEGAPRREHLSRGQEKLCALACVLAQAEVFAEDKGEWPVVCIDDLASELDEPHQLSLVRALRRADAQVLITGTHESRALADLGPPIRRFHVEQGRIGALL